MDAVNMSREIEERLTPKASAAVAKASSLARARGEKLYLAGGAVRDLLLGKPALDIDLVLEGDAIALAHELARGENAKITLHKPFLTANIEWPDLSLDLAAARRESYARPGVLPAVEPGNLKDDLYRRDFSINAMAVSLNDGDYGRLIDYYGGLGDLRDKLVRTLHEKSFIDDATRMWRAVRYEQRLDFHIEAETLVRLKQNLPMLKTISGDRIWYELECAFGEKLPEKVFARAGELGILQFLHPELIVHKTLSEWFSQARRTSLPHNPPIGLYMALLTYNLDEPAIEEFAAYVNLGKALTQTLRDSHEIKSLREELSEEIMQPSAIYQHLHGFSEEALTANLIAGESAEMRNNIRLYLDELRYVKTELNGDDLIALGIKQGPDIKLLLGLVLDARLDGEAASRDDEIELLRQFS